MTGAPRGDYPDSEASAPNGDGDVRDPAGSSAAPDHGVQFYQSDGFLWDAVADFVGDGLLAGDPVVVLATEQNRDGFIGRLATAGLSWDEAHRSRRLTWLDARSALESVMAGGRVPDPGRFDAHVASVVRTACSRGDHTRVRVYGELVDLLWQDGNPEGALLLEDMWNDLARAHAFSLLCAYSMGNIYTESRGKRFRQICDRHSHVLPPEGSAPGAEPSWSGSKP